jgi:DNA-binding response OmpR family regulator
MSDEGFIVDAVTSSRQGVERALSEDYALILLDVMMPRVNGFDVLKRIRRASPTPVLMLTAEGDARDRVRGLELGADDYLPKPFEPSELAARIRAILRRVNSRPVGGPGRIIVADLELDTGTEQFVSKERSWN